MLYITILLYFSNYYILLYFNNLRHQTQKPSWILIFPKNLFPNNKYYNFLFKDLDLSAKKQLQKYSFHDLAKKQSILAPYYIWTILRFSKYFPILSYKFLVSYKGRFCEYFTNEKTELGEVNLLIQSQNQRNRIQSSNHWPGIHAIALGKRI